MKKYIDSEGTIVEAFQTEGPITINTINGEVTGSVGDWVVYMPSGTVILPNSTFNVSFTEVI